MLSSSVQGLLSAENARVPAIKIPGDLGLNFTLLDPLLKLSGSLMMTAPSYFISLVDDILFVFSYLASNENLV